MLVDGGEKSALFKNQKKKRARVFRTRGTRNSASRSAPHARETMVSIAICRAPFGDLGEKPVRGNTASSFMMPCLIVEEATYLHRREIEKDLFEKCLGFPYVMGDDQ